MLAVINNNIIAMASHKPSKNPPSYPRANKKKDGNHIGEGAVPQDELKQIFIEKRKQRMNNV